MESDIKKEFNLQIYENSKWGYSLSQDNKYQFYLHYTYIMESDFGNEKNIKIQLQKKDPVHSLKIKEGIFVNMSFKQDIQNTNIILLKFREINIDNILKKLL